MKVLLLVALLLVAPFLYADEIDDLKKEEAKINAEIRASDNEITRLVSESAKMNQQFISFGCKNEKGGIDHSKCDIQKINNNVTAYGVLVNKWNSSQAELESVMGDIKKLQADAKKAKTRYTALAEADAKRAPAEAIEHLLKIGKIQDIEAGVRANWNEADQKFDDLDANMDQLGRVIDASAIGLYFQDKMGQFVNSQLACEMYSRCRVKERKEVDNKYIKELFPYMPDSTRRSSKKYYDKTGARKGSSKGNQ